MIHFQKSCKKGGVEMIHLPQACKKGGVEMINFTQECKKWGVQMIHLQNSCKKGRCRSRFIRKFDKYINFFRRKVTFQGKEKEYKSYT